MTSEDITEALAYYQLEGLSYFNDHLNARLCSVVCGLVSGKVPDANLFLLHPPPKKKQVWQDVRAQCAAAAEACKIVAEGKVVRGDKIGEG